MAKPPTTATNMLTLPAHRLLRRPLGTVDILPTSSSVPPPAFAATSWLLSRFSRLLNGLVREEGRLVSTVEDLFPVFRRTPRRV